MQLSELAGAIKKKKKAPGQPGKIKETAAKHKWSYLGFNLPTGDGGLAVVARFKLQRDGSRADVGDR